MHLPVVVDNPSPGSRSSDDDGARLYFDTRLCLLCDPAPDAMERDTESAPAAGSTVREERFHLPRLDEGSNTSSPSSLHPSNCNHIIEQTSAAPVATALSRLCKCLGGVFTPVTTASKRPPLRCSTATSGPSSNFLRTFFSLLILLTVGLDVTNCIPIR